MALAKGFRIGVAAAAVALASAAHANLGEGVQLGEKGRVRPYLDVEERYDSAVVFDANASPKGDLVTHVRPGLTLELPTRFVDFAAAAHLDWAQYASESNLSRLYAGATVRAAAFRNNPVGVELVNEFRRSDRTTTQSFAYAAISTYNDLQLWIPWRPGGGALTFAAGGGYTVEHFDPLFKGIVCTNNWALCDTSNASKLSYSEVRGTAQARWRFLPRTAGLFDFAYVTRLPSDTTLSKSVERVEFRTGVSGLVTPRLAATVKGGYGDTMGTGGKSYGAPLADIEMEWLPAAGWSARVGYLRSLGTDPGLPFALYRTQRLFVESRGTIGSIYTLRLTGSYDRMEPDGVQWAPGLGVVEPRIDADLKPWLRLGAGYAFSYRCQGGVRSCLDRMFTADANGVRNAPELPSYLNYKKHEVFLRADVIY